MVFLNKNILSFLSQIYEILLKVISTYILKLEIMKI
jgi:hypothetical protein